MEYHKKIKCLHLHLTTLITFRKNVVSGYWRIEDTNRFLELLTYTALHSTYVTAQTRCELALSHSEFSHSASVSLASNRQTLQTGCHCNGSSADRRLPVLTKMFHLTSSYRLTWTENLNGLALSCFLSRHPFGSAGNRLLRIYHKRLLRISKFNLPKGVNVI
jgi:hypothetical protein